MVNQEGRQRLRILDCVAAMQEGATLQECALAMTAAAGDLVDCEICGYVEVDEHFGRTFGYWNVPGVQAQAMRRAEVWRQFLPPQPVLQFLKAHPGTAVVRRSDVPDMSDFHRGGLRHERVEEGAARNQLVVHLGFDPAQRVGRATFPLALCLPLSRSGRDFTAADMAVLAALQRVVRPVLRQKRARHHLDLMDRAELAPELCRMLMGFGLTDRQAEVAFWMLKGKSNADIAAILDIGAQTVRHHAMAIFARLGVGGRLALQRAVIRSMLEAG
jgi:DNA-binding CsgD family transcriptional regulator